VIVAGVWLNGLHRRVGKRPRGVAAVLTGGGKLASGRAMRLAMLTFWLAAVIVFAYLPPATPEIYRLADSDCVIVRRGDEAFVFDAGADTRALKGFLDCRGVRRVSYFALSNTLNRADATIDRLGNVVAVFAAPGLAGLGYYETRGIYYSGIAPGDTLARDGLEFYITDGFGVRIRAGSEEIVIRK
jgi:hypothetical protein